MGGEDSEQLLPRSAVLTAPARAAPLMAAASFFLCYSQPLALAFIYNS